MTQGEEYYTHGHHPVVVDAHARRGAGDSAEFLLAHLQPGSRLLDFGCGPGSITADLAEIVGSAGSVIGVDSSAEAIAIARRDSAATGAEYVAASVYELPFAEAEFDVAYGHQVLQHLAEPVPALLEVRRVLRPGGLLAVRDADYGSMTHYPHYPELDRWRDLYTQVARSNGGEPNAGRRLVHWAQQAGFTLVRASASSWHYTTPEERAAWAELWAGRIRLPRFADRAATLGLGADIDTIAAAWRRWANEPDGWFAFLHGEVIAKR
ncbi:MAG: methyltransferase domain-containing protein [Acidimicrobiia bacterium]|nr:methyltransferase domain-containing protein [Acidimicrobiia bacterium]